MTSHEMSIVAVADLVVCGMVVSMNQNNRLLKRGASVDVNELLLHSVLLFDLVVEQKNVTPRIECD